MLFFGGCSLLHVVACAISFLHFSCRPMGNAAALVLLSSALADIWPMRHLSFPISCNATLVGLLYGLHRVLPVLRASAEGVGKLCCL